MQMSLFDIKIDRKLKVREAIKNIDYFIVTHEGSILAIKNGRNEKIITKDNEIEDKEVRNIDIQKGMYADYTCIRI